MKDFVYSLLPFKEKIGYGIARTHLYQPIFLIGCGRSGTTALGRALGQHPEIRSASTEGALINHIGGVAHHYCCHEVKDYVQNSTSLKSGILRTQLIKLIYEVVWGPHYGLRFALSTYLRNIGRHVPSRWLVKAFPDEREYAGLTFLFPRTKFVYIYRDGMDVVNSMTKFGWFAHQPFEDLCIYWQTHMERYRYIEEQGVLVVRFEEFVEQPEKELSRIFKYVGLQEDNNAALFARTKVVHPLDQPDLEESPKEMLRKRPAAYLQWTTKQKDSFKDICGETMRNYGYGIPF